MHLERNEYLKMDGSIDTNVYYIKSGSLRLYIIDNDQDQILRFGYADNFMIALDSFFTRKPSNILIQAIKKSEVWVIRKTDLDDFLQVDSNKSIWMQVLENLVVQQLQREVDILTDSPTERYLRVLRRSPQLFQEIPNKHIANYLRMSPETLSRLKSK